MTIELYTSKQNRFGSEAKAFLEHYHIPIKAFSIDEDPVAAKKMVEVSGQYSSPVLVIDGEVILGFFEKEVVRKLAEHGYVLQIS